MDKLPTEIYFHDVKEKSIGIFSFLNIQELIKFKRTCKSNKDIVNYSLKNNIIDFYIFNIAKKNFKL